MPGLEEMTITTNSETHQHENVHRQQKQRQQHQNQQQQEEEQDDAVVVTKEQESTLSTTPPTPQTHHVDVAENEDDEDEIIFVATTSKKKQRMMNVIQDEEFQGEHADYALLQFRQLMLSLGHDNNQHQQQANLEEQDNHDMDLDESSSDGKITWSNRHHNIHNENQYHLNGRNNIIGHVSVDDDDDILFVTTKPIPSSKSSSRDNVAEISSSESYGRWYTVLFSREEQHHEGVWEILQVFLLLLIAAVVFVKFSLSKTRRTPNGGKQKHRILEIEKERAETDKNSEKPLPEIPAKTPDDVSSISETNAMKHSYESTQFVTKRPRKEGTIQATPQKVRKTSHLLSAPSEMPPPLTDESSERNQTLMIESTNENLALEFESASVSLSSPPVVVNGEENGMILSHQKQKLSIQQSDLHQQHISKKVMAKQLVRDIKMVQEVLEEHNLDPSLAPNLAISLQTSHHIVDTQNKLEYKRTIIDVHQRQLDRRLSERQHIETLRAARYDPDWRGKLLGIVLTDDAGTNFAPTQQNGRKRFAATTYLMSRISSIWWNVFWVQQLCRGLTPYMIQHYSGMFNNDQLFGTTTKTSYESARILGRMIQNLIWAALSHLCRCDDIGQEYQPSRVSIVESSRSNEGYTSFLDIFLTWTKPSFTSPEGDSSGYAWILLKSAKHVLFSSVVPVVEGCTCYGSCVLSISTLILASILIHQGFRVVSAPQTCHHAVNLFTLMAIWGPDQIIKVLLSSILFLTGRNKDKDQIIAGETDNMFWREVADLLTLTILFFVPVWEWQATRRVYYQTESQIDQATPADFDAKFKWGRYRLEQWVTYTQHIRFVIFSVYSSVILWSVFR